MRLLSRYELKKSKHWQISLTSKGRWFVVSKRGSTAFQNKTQALAYINYLNKGVL